MKLLFNCLPFSMKDSELVARSNKKAKGNNNNTSPITNNNGKTKTTPTKLSSSVNQNGNNKSNGTSSPIKPRALSVDLSKVNKRARKQKDVKEKLSPTKTKRRKIETNKSNTSPRGQKKGNSKSSPELRPRRRASQTYFFKYQLARNPLKAEEEDLKLALLASLQQCGNSTPTTISNPTNSNESTTQNTNASQANTSKSPQKQQNQNNLIQNNHQQKQPKLEETNLPLVTKTQPVKYDEEYLKRYRPETEDFLTFICFRITAPKYNPDQSKNEIANVVDGTKETVNQHCATANNAHLKIGVDQKLISYSNDSQNLKRSSSPYKLTNASNSPNNLSPSNRRRPTRQSPRLASSNRKISELDSSNHINTAYDNSINYEEDVKRASIALEDMAQEINGKDDVHNPIAQDSSDSNLRLSASPFKNNKHLVKGLMTREFAGAFADEEIIFESISNHKL